jgi:kumamolisin
MSTPFELPHDRIVTPVTPVVIANMAKWGGPYQPFFHLYRHSAKFSAHIAPKPLTTKQVAKAYKFPTSFKGKPLDGTGQTIGILELGGGYYANDLDASLKNLSHRVTDLSVDDAVRSPGGDADGEVELDIEVSGAVAPSAKLLCAFAPNSAQGIVDGIVDLRKKKVNVISLSWGGPEDTYTAAQRSAINQAIEDCEAQGISVCVASGDNGYNDGDEGLATIPHVDFPSSSPFALSCGGTSLFVKADGSILSEYVWNDLSAGGGAGGGGVSDYFEAPSFQAGCQYLEINGVPTYGKMRMSPDVAGNASPGTGYLVVIDGQLQPVGGTSAVAPLWAGLIALLQQALGHSVPTGLMHALYRHKNTPMQSEYFNTKISGSNGRFLSVPDQYDCTCGNGSPNGEALLAMLASL